jgi:hypothetical protein
MERRPTAKLPVALGPWDSTRRSDGRKQLSALTQKTNTEDNLGLAVDKRASYAGAKWIRMFGLERSVIFFSILAFLKSLFEK